MAIQLKDTKFGDTIVTKTSGMYSFDAAVDTTGGFSVTGANGPTFSVNGSGGITGSSLSVDGLLARGLSASSEGVSMSDVNVGNGAFKVDGCGNVSVRNELDITDENGNEMAYVSNGTMTLKRSTASGMRPMFDVNYSCGLILYDSVNGDSVFNVGDGFLTVRAYSSATGTRTVFDVNNCGLHAFDNSGDEFFMVDPGNLAIRGRTSSGMKPVFDVATCGGLNFYNDSGQLVFYTKNGSLSVSGYNYDNQRLQTVFDVDSCGGLDFYNYSGNQVFRASDGSLFVSGYSSSTGGMRPVFEVTSFGLDLYDDSGQIVFNAGNGNLFVSGFDQSSSGYYAKFSVDSCGIYVNLGNASGHLMTTSVPGSGSSSVTVLTLG